MRPLPVPAFNANDVYRRCLDGITDSRRALFESCLFEIEAAANDYLDKSGHKTWYQLQQTENVGCVLTVDDMTWLYTQRFVAAVAARRQFYDLLMAAPSHGICPMCGYGHVSSLDHFMPKQAYPAYAVLPQNLIPCCSDCNKKKAFVRFQKAEEQTLHAYFDQITDNVWLVATLQQTSPPAMTFAIVPPANADPTLIARVNMHFKILQLRKRYGLLAGQLLQESKHLFDTLRRRSSNALLQHLLLSAETYQKPDPNCWQHAAYRCLSGSAWFVNVGA